MVTLVASLWPACMNPFCSLEEGQGGLSTGHQVTINTIYLVISSLCKQVCYTISLRPGSSVPNYNSVKEREPWPLGGTDICNNDPIVN